MGDLLMYRRRFRRRGGGSTTGWQRPSDWLVFPDDVANKITVMAGVWDHDSNFCALTCTVTGGYTVDWGDGTVENVASAAVAEHIYDFADTGLDGSLTSEGFKQAVIVVTPQTGGNDFTNVQLSTKHSQAGLGTYSQPWLDVRLNTPNCMTLAMGGTCKCRIVRRIDIVAMGLATSTPAWFDSCNSVEDYNFPAGFGSETLNTVNMFADNHAIRKFSFPAGFGSKAVSSYYTFARNYSTIEYDFPAGFGALMENCSALFLSNHAAVKFGLPAGFGAAMTNTGSLFYNCFSGSSFGSVESPISFSVANARLSAAALDALYTALPTVTGQTVTVTGNWGTATHDPSIATAKGWTVVS